MLESSGFPAAYRAAPTTSREDNNARSCHYRRRLKTADGNMNYNGWIQIFDRGIRATISTL